MSQQTVSGITGKNITLPQLTGTELPSAACAKISAALNRPLPETCGQIPLFSAAKLHQAQRAVRAFDRAVILLLILTPLIVIAALALSRRRRRTLLQLVVGAMLVMVILRRTVMWLQNDLINTGRPENKDARSVIVQGLLHGFFTASVWVLAIAVGDSCRRAAHRSVRVGGEASRLGAFRRRGDCGAVPGRGPSTTPPPRGSAVTWTSCASAAGSWRFS